VRRYRLGRIKFTLAAGQGSASWALSVPSVVDGIDGGNVSNDRAARLGVGLAGLWLLALSVANLFLPASSVPDPLLPVAALITCAVCSAGTTAAVAVAAVALTVLSGVYNDNWDTAQQWVRLLAVVLVGGAAIVVAVVRIRRERSYARMAAIAEVAQRVILPTLPKTAGSVRATARYWSSAEDAMVGGDLYDCSLVGGHVRFLIGDMRGKGLGAIEQAARVIRAFRQAAALHTDLDGVASDMDAYLIPFFDEEDFVTALIVDASRPDQLTLVACGHPQPLMVRANGAAELVEAPPGLPLGLGGAYDAITVPWRSGDRLLLYTDGISEARGSDGEFLPLLSLAPDVGGATLDEAMEACLATVRDHVPSGELSDDAALVLLENASGVTQHASAAAVQHA
jgi:phosphoserine phosphatase RsbU/P